MRSRGFSLIELMTVVVILGVLFAIGYIQWANATDRSKEAAVKSNCHTIQLTVEDFAVMQGGVYPDDLADPNVAGDTIIDLLPGGQRVLNPFTKLNTEPIDGVAGTPGQSGYAPVVDGSGTNIGYMITGFGRDVVVATLTNG